MNHLCVFKGKQHKVKSRRGASVVFSIVGFMFAAMISLVVVSAAFSNAVKTKKQRYEEQSFLAAQSMAGIVSDALSGEALDGNALDVSSGLSMSYQYIDYIDPDTGDTVTYYREGSDGVNYVETGVAGTFKKGDSKSFHNVKGATLANGTAAKSMRELIKLMARDVEQGNAGEKKASFDTSTTINGMLCKASVDVEMSDDYTLKFKITGDAGGKAQYVVTITARASVSADRPQLSMGTISDDKETITVPSIGNAAVNVLNGEQSYKVVTYTVKWPSNQIKSAASQVHVPVGEG